MAKSGLYVDWFLRQHIFYFIMLSLSYVTPRSLNKGDTNIHILIIKLYLLPLPFLYQHMTLVLIQNELSMCHQKKLWSYLNWKSYEAQWFPVIISIVELFLKRLLCFCEKCHFSPSELLTTAVTIAPFQALKKISSQLKRNYGIIYQKLFPFPQALKGIG